MLTCNTGDNPKRSTDTLPEPYKDFRNTMWNSAIFLERTMDRLMPYLDAQTMTKELMITKTS